MADEKIDYNKVISGQIESFNNIYKNVMVKLGELQTKLRETRENYNKKYEELSIVQTEKEKEQNTDKGKDETRVEDVNSNQVPDSTHVPDRTEEDTKPEKLNDDFTEDDFIRKPAPIEEKPVQPVVQPNINSQDNQHNNKPGFNSKKDKYNNKNYFDDESNKNNKQDKTGKFKRQNVGQIIFDEDGEIIERRRTRTIRKEKAQQPTQAVKTQIDHFVMTTKTISIKAFSEKIGKSVTEIIKKLFVDFDMQLTINDSIDTDLAVLIGDAFNVNVELNVEATKEEELESLHDDAALDSPELLKERPPVVTVMGHVDHGKTSILDYVRKTSIASKEEGGITQYIGAYTITVPFEGEKKSITFLDTPGHEAFTAMRARGANITDIIVLVVAADDGIMPQTIEAISHAKAAKVPLIVAINKIDKVAADPARVIQQLAEHGVLSEEWGGDVPTVRVSAVTGEGINKLLENILTIAAVSELKANPSRNAKGTVIESQLDKGRGPVASILVQNGTLKVGDYVVMGTVTGRIRTMVDDKGNNVKKATPSMPVSITGLKNLPESGDQMLVVDNERLAKQVVEERLVRENLEREQTISKNKMYAVVNSEQTDRKELNLIIKADVNGTCEAVKQSLIKLSTDEVEVKVVHAQVGAIIESDIDLASTTNSTIIGFNVRVDAKNQALADRKGVSIKQYKIIYQAVDEINKAIKGLLEPTYEESILGTAEIRKVFRITGVGTIAGSMVKTGVITRNDKARLIRDGVVIYDSFISSLRKGKDDAKDVAAGFECGICLNNYADIKENDIIEAYALKEIE
ncbi:MAG: translation initiation factor IF-2 [Clostridia bacterium]|nr:translation initiation factor IF-2 [Clostridia bacterium]